MANEMETQQPLRNVSESGGQPSSGHGAWIAGRIQTLLSHYYQQDNPMEVHEAAIEDWVDILSPFSRDSIEAACSGYLKDQPRRRPTPGDIRQRAAGHREGSGKARDQGDRNKLGFDELKKLDEEVLPAARRWLKIPGLRHHGENTLLIGS